MSSDTERPRRRSLAFVVLLGLIALGLGIALLPKPKPAYESAQERIEQPAAQFESSASPSASALDTASEPLASASESVGETPAREHAHATAPAPEPGSFEALVRDALEGDAEAGCRLLIEALQCEVQRSRAEQVAQAIDRLAVEGENPFVLEFAARTLNEREARAQLCNSAPHPDALTRRDELGARLLGLPVRARVLMAMTLADGRIMRLRSDQPENHMTLAGSGQEILPEFIAEHGLRFLAEGLQQGDPLALEGVLIVHAPGLLMPAGFNGRFFALPHPRRFALYALTARALWGDEALQGTGVLELLDATLAGMAPETRHRLEAEAIAEVARWRSVGGKEAPRGSASERDPAALCLDPG